ncbi:MAG: hypothetical protein JXQ23_05900 [Clostridia bacterium]|nr:hypothetical protein [Clostridia bacterium]
MRRWTFFALIISVVAVVLFLVSFMFNIYLQGPIAELQSLKDQNSLMTESISRLSYIQEMFDTIEVNSGIINTLKGKNVDWTYVFDLSSNNITLHNISVKQIKIDAKAEGVNCTIVGECNSINEMTAWANSTRELDGIGSVELVDINKLQTSNEKSAFYFVAQIQITKWNVE